MRTPNIQIESYHSGWITAIWNCWHLQIAIWSGLNAERPRLNVNIWIKFPSATYVFVVGRISFYLWPMPCAYIPIVAWHEFTMKSEYFSHERVCLCWRQSVREISGGCFNSCPFISTTPFAYDAQNVSNSWNRTRLRRYVMLRTTYIWTNASATFTTNSDPIFCDSVCKHTWSCGCRNI